jgi:predicted nucleic acid-binding protein
MYLLDTNIWLERLLDQDNSEVVGELLDTIPLNQIFISDFSFHSICIILTRHKQSQTLIDFIEDVVTNAHIKLLTCRPEEVVLVVDAMLEFGFDFDDGYQHVIANQNNLTMVSFDSDFDKGPLGRKTPKDILAKPSQF